MASAVSRRLAVVLAALPLVLAGLAGSARADGALAIGMKESGAQDGFDYGYSFGYEPEKAKTEAMKECRKQGGDVARLCRVVEVFSKACLAVAMDPKNGTSGVGWGIAPTKILAERMAIAACHETANEGRRLECKIDASVCEEP